MCKKFLITIIAFLSSLMVEASEILVEAESFHQKGGWVVDQQFMDQMGSSYLLAHGMGKPVDDATTTIHVKEGGLYYICKDIQLDCSLEQKVWARSLFFVC